MSAFLCEPEHVSALAAYACHHKLTDAFAADPVEIANHLYDCNRHALIDLYRERADPAPPFVYAADHDSVFYVSRLDPLRVLKSVRCYSYQACEWRHWTGSRAQEICEAITWHAIGRLPGYDKANWGTP